MAGVDRRVRGSSDLGVRTVSAVVMVVVAGVAIWFGGLVFTLFAVLIGLAVLAEWIGLTRAFARSTVAKVLWALGGLVYIGVAVHALAFLNATPERLVSLLSVIGAVIATDIGAYFTGRTFGGPKIAPRISPSKTWSGLVGGMVGAAAVVVLAEHFSYLAGRAMGVCTTAGGCVPNYAMAALAGAIVAIVAQTGDFFESWMKRRAGVKDSGSLIPGHGGLFDRVDGLLAVLFVLGLAVSPVL